MNRPIINTRDEPHADQRRHRRLHVITGDATQAEWSTWLKVGTAGLVLRALEAGRLDGVPRPTAPVAALRTVSHDPTCTAVIETDDGGRSTAVDLQRRYLERCRDLVAADEFGSAAQYEEARALLEAWQTVLDALGRDPLELRDRLEWVAKWHLLESYRQRGDLAWDAARLAQIDLQFSDVDPARGLYAALAAKGRLRRLVTDEEVAAAVDRPPSDTRAWLRGEMMRRHADAVVAASWDTIILDVPGRRTLQRLELSDPLADTHETRHDLVEQAPSLTQLVAAWSAAPRPVAETPVAGGPLPGGRRRPGPPARR